MTSQWPLTVFVSMLIVHTLTNGFNGKCKTRLLLKWLIAVGFS